MTRVVLVNLLLFLLPFFSYVLYVYFVRQNTDPKSILDDAPINWLLIAGSILVIGTLASFVTFSGSNVSGKYQAPVLKDGKVQPGQIKE